MLERQAVQEYEGLKDKIRENQGLLSANGEVIRITEDDSVSPIQTVQGNIRLKYDRAERDIERCQESVIDLQSKVTEKNALLQNHRGRLAQLKARANNLDHEDGAVQKISRVVRAITCAEKILLSVLLTCEFVDQCASERAARLCG
jgi:chromosome segregation ATPase